MTTTTIGTPQQAAPRPRARRLARYALTALRILLAVEFAGAGLMKLGGVESTSAPGSGSATSSGRWSSPGPSACWSRGWPASPPSGSPG
jgi:uncharacterized membrane protein YphA (DoxX/SURF4 family)